MSRIIRAINTMVSNPAKITHVSAAKGLGLLMGKTPQSEVFFLYDGRHKWSIQQTSETDDFVLKHFTTSQSIEFLASSVLTFSPHVQIISYSAIAFKTREAIESMSELHTIVQEKLLGIGDVLDDIIGPDPD